MKKVDGKLAIYKLYLGRILNKFKKCVNGGLFFDNFAVNKRKQWIYLNNLIISGLVNNLNTIYIINKIIIISPPLVQ